MGKNQTSTLSVSGSCGSARREDPRAESERHRGPACCESLWTVELTSKGRQEFINKGEGRAHRPVSSRWDRQTDGWVVGTTTLGFESPNGAPSKKLPFKEKNQLQVSTTGSYGVSLCPDTGAVADKLSMECKNQAWGQHENLPLNSQGGLMSFVFSSKCPQPFLQMGTT